MLDNAVLNDLWMAYGLEWGNPCFRHICIHVCVNVCVYVCRPGCACVRTYCDIPEVVP